MCDQPVSMELNMLSCNIGVSVKNYFGKSQWYLLQTWVRGITDTTLFARTCAGLGHALLQNLHGLD